MKHLAAVTLIVRRAVVRLLGGGARDRSERHVVARRFHARRARDHGHSESPHGARRDPVARRTRRHHVASFAHSRMDPLRAASRADRCRGDQGNLLHRGAAWGSGRAGLSDPLDGEFLQRRLPRGYPEKTFRRDVARSRRRTGSRFPTMRSRSPRSTWTRISRTSSAAGLDIDRLKDQGLLISQSPGETMGNSDAMTGTIGVTLFFVESDGSIDPNTYTWTAQHQQDYINGVNTGLAWWTSVSYNYFDCWNAFMVHYYPATDSRCNQGYEPVLHNGTGTAPNAQYVDRHHHGEVRVHDGRPRSQRVTAFNTAQRAAYGTNWAYSAFIPYNPPPAAQQFLGRDARRGRMLGGPYTVCSLPDLRVGPEPGLPARDGAHFLRVRRVRVERVQRATASATLRDRSQRQLRELHGGRRVHDEGRIPSASARGHPAQVGWDGTGCAPAPLPAPVATSVSANNDYQGVTTTITVSGSNFVWGAFVEMGSDVTVNSTTFINSTSFQTNITISNTAAPGFRNVVVKNRDLQSSTITNGFTIKESTKHYSSPSGGNVFPYITPANAAATLAGAIGAAGAGDSVLVVSNTYTSVDFTIAQGVKMYGAWDPSFTSRNLASGKTVLQLSGNVEIGPGAPGASVIDGFEIYGGIGSPQVLAGRGPLRRRDLGEHLERHRGELSHPQLAGARRHLRRRRRDLRVGRDGRHREQRDPRLRGGAGRRGLSRRRARRPLPGTTSTTTISSTRRSPRTAEGSTRRAARRSGSRGTRST